MTSVVLDASALMALLRSEPGSDQVAKSLKDSVISAVNYSEILKKTIERGGEGEPVTAFIHSLSIAIIPFDELQAEVSASLYPETKEHGMSFADRACLALGVIRSSLVLTSERKMGLLSLAVKVKVIRNGGKKNPAPAVFPPAVLQNAAQAVSTVAALADIPEEDIWLAKQKSKRTRRAYKQDVRHFMRTLTIRSYEGLRKVDHRAVIAWERIMREIEEAAPSTVRRRLAALSSLFKHLKGHHHVENNPVADVERPAINRREGSTLAFSKADAAKLLNTPAEDTIDGLRDRAILSVGLQVGLRRAEIAALSVEDLHQNRGFDSLRIVRKGSRRDALAIHPNVAQRIRAYLAAAGHADDLDGPMFRPLSHNRKGQEPRRHMDPDAIDRVLRKHAATIGHTRGYSAHSMRATFITTALENGATLDDVQRAAGHSEPGTTKLYDRRGYNPEKSASFFATY